MVDPLTAGAIAVAATGLANLVTDILKDSAKDAVKESVDGGTKQLLGWFGETMTLKAAEQAIFSMSRKYVETYQERHGILKVLGMREPVSLESVYTAVCFLDQNFFFQRFASIADLETAYRQDRAHRLRQQSISRQQGIQVADAKQYLMVLSAPGSGKSTFLRKMGLEALRGNRTEYSHCCIPVFLELKRFDSSNIDVKKRISSEFETCGFPDAQRFTDEALDKGRLLILLDGLDEVPSNHVNRTIGAIQDFVDRHAKNRYIASCRIAAYRGSFRRFSDVTMAEFEASQIQKFIDNWFCSEEDQKNNTAAKCWQVLQQPMNTGARELAHSPLLLTFLCLVYDRSQNFPSNRSVLYRKALRILLEEWAAEKRLETQRQIYEGLSVELEEDLLAEIAAKGFAKDQLFFSQRELVDRIKAFLASNLNAPKHLDGERVLEAIAVQQGILVERAEDAYSFSHLTLQEHLTARYLIDNPESIRVAKCVADERWREVFLLIAGLMPGSKGVDPLLLIMEKQTQAYINTPKLKALLQWSAKVTAESKGNYKPAAKRASAIVLALDLDFDPDFVYALALAIDLVRPSTPIRAYNFTHARTRARALTRPRDPDRTLALSRTRGLALAIAHTFDLDIDLGRDTLDSVDLSLDFATAHATAYEFEKNKIFKSIDFAKLISMLRTLSSQVSDNYRPLEVRRTLVDRLYQVWFDALGLDRGIAMLSGDEVKSLADYLYVCELMVRCKEAAVRVSPQTWEAIEGRMLLPPD